MMEKPITPLVSTAFPKKRNRVGAVQKYDSSILSSLATNTTTDSDEPSDTARIPSVDEFILRSKEQSFNCLENAYLADHELCRSVDDGSVFTTLCEDVFSLANIQVDLMHEYLLVKKIEKSEVGLNVILVTLLGLVRTLQKLQLQHRDRFLQDLESSCAAANDFMRMIDCFDDLWEAVNRRYPRLSVFLQATSQKNSNSEKMALLERESSDLVSLYGNDAVFSVQRSQMFVMKIIHKSSIKQELFSPAWEDDYVFNEVSLAIVNTLEDFLCECHEYISTAFLYAKLVSTLVQSTVCFYFQCLVQKADRARRQKRKLAFGARADGPFRNPRRAVLRMLYDLEVFRTYFQNMAEQLPGLSKVVDDEMSVLIVLHECLIALAENTGAAALEELIVVLHKRTGANAAVTRFIIKDLGLLLACRPGQRRRLNTMLDNLDVDLRLLSSHLGVCQRESKQMNSRHQLQGLRLKESLEQLYEHRIIFQGVQSFGPCINFARKTLGEKNTGNRPVPSPTPTTPIQPTMKQTVSSTSCKEFLWVPDGDKPEKGVVIPDYAKKDKAVAQSHQVSPTLIISKEEHEQKLKVLKEKLFATLKLHNLHFITKHSADEFERRLAEINERIW